MKKFMIAGIALIALICSGCFESPVGNDQPKPEDTVSSPVGNDQPKPEDTVSSPVLNWVPDTVELNRSAYILQDTETGQQYIIVKVGYGVAMYPRLGNIGDD